MKADYEVAPEIHAVAAKLCNEIARARLVTAAAIRGRKRTRQIARARCEWYSALRALGLSLPEIGTLVDRDHTTVMAGIRSHRATRQP